MASQNFCLNELHQAETSTAVDLNYAYTDLRMIFHACIDFLDRNALCQRRQVYLAFRDLCGEVRFEDIFVARVTREALPKEARARR